MSAREPGYRKIEKEREREREREREKRSWRSTAGIKVMRTGR